MPLLENPSSEAAHRRAVDRKNLPGDRAIHRLLGSQLPHYLMETPVGPDLDQFSSFGSTHVTVTMALTSLAELGLRERHAER
jgi:hypothetical protein